jgi:hypothetical protein
MDIGDFSLYAILCVAVQTPRETTPNAKVAGWTPARATTPLVAHELALHGVVMEKTTKPLDLGFETWRFTDVKYVAAGFESDLLVNHIPHPVKEKIWVPESSYWVPLNHSRARLIMELSQPAVPDMRVRWGSVGSIFQGLGRIGAAEYLSVLVATKMAVDNPNLMEEFQARLKGDATLAADL